MKIFDIVKGIAECTTEILFELFSGETSSSNSNNTSTYNYWMSLDYKEQFEYFQSNEYLRDYMKNDYYSCDRHLTAMHVQHIADRMNKEFTNKYNRY
jgi:hypothetical protein